MAYKITHGSDKVVQKSSINPRLHRRDMPTVEVTEKELRSIGSGNFLASLFSGVFGLTFGTAVTIAVTLSTLTFGESQVWVYATFVAILALMAVLSLVFGLLCWYFFAKSRGEIDEIWNQRASEDIEGNRT